MPCSLQIISEMPPEKCHFLKPIFHSQITNYCNYYSKNGTSWINNAEIRSRDADGKTDNVGPDQLLTWYKVVA